MISELNITWDLVYNDTLNSSDTLNMTQLESDYNYTINTSNCGMCPTTCTTSSTSATCNVTMSDLLAGTCNVTVVVHAVVCGITTEATSEEYSVRLMNGEIYHELIRATIIILYVLKLLQIFLTHLLHPIQ